MAERDLIARTQRYLTSVGAYHVKIHGGSWGRVGVPDLLVCHRGLFIGMEGKMPGNYPTKAQKREIELIIRAGGRAGVVRDLDDVKELLS